MGRKTLAALTLGLLLAAGLGCAATGQVVVRQPLAAAALDGCDELAVKVYVEAQEAIPEADALAALLMDGLRARAVCRAVVADADAASPPPDRGLAVAVTAIRRVTETDRIMGGALAGRASLTAIVRLVALPSREPLGEARVTGESSGGSIAAGGTEEAIDEAARQIVDFVAGPPVSAGAQRAE